MSGYVLDFYCPELRLGIEVDGDSHFSSQAQAYDTMREQFLVRKDIKIIRFTNTEITKNLNQVIDKLLEYLPQPLLP